MLSLLFGFHGRINRAQYWLGSLLSQFAGFILAALVVSIGAGAAMDASGQGQKMAIASSSMLLVLPIFALMAWIGFAVQVKRFHDRGRTGWIAAVPLALMCVAFFGVIGDAINNVPAVQAVSHLGPYAGLFWLVGLWFFVDLGCLPGVDGANKYGNPPGSGGAQPTPGAPSPNPAAFLSAQSAMDRAISQRDTTPVTSVKPRANAMQPAQQTFVPQVAPASAGPRAFGRRASH